MTSLHFINAERRAASLPTRPAELHYIAAFVFSVAIQKCVWTGLRSRLKCSISAESNGEACEMENQVFVKQVIQINPLLSQRPAVYINKNCPPCPSGGANPFDFLTQREREKKKNKCPVSFCKSHNGLFPPSLFTSSLLWIWERHSHCHAGWKNLLHDSSSFSILTGKDLFKRRESQCKE